MDEEFRVKLVTRDGQLVQNRKSDPRYWFRLNMEVDKVFADISMTEDCREKGVKLISYEVTVDGVVGIVEWC